MKSLSSPEQVSLAPANGFLSHASLDERLALSKMARPVTLRPDQVLFQRGDPYLGFYAVLKGTMKLYRGEAAGRQLVLNLPREGELFGEASLCTPGDENRCPFSASAMTACTLLFFPAAPAAEFIRSRPHLFQALLERVAFILERISDHLESVSLLGVRSRLARFLLSAARSAEDNHTLSVRLDMPKSVLAAHLGTVPETLSRALRVLLDEHLIREERNEILLLNPARLRSVAQGEPELERTASRSHRAAGADATTESVQY